MSQPEQRDVVVVHNLVSSAGGRLVKDWTERTLPDATIVSLHDEWSATAFHDDTVLFPVELATDDVGLGHIVVGVPATIGAFRQLHYIGDEGTGTLEQFIARSVALAEKAVQSHE